MYGTSLHCRLKFAWPRAAGMCTAQCSVQPRCFNACPSCPTLQMMWLSLIEKCAAENVAFFLLPEPLCDPKICLKFVCGRGSAPDPAGGDHYAPPGPLVDWGGGYPSPHLTPSAPRLSRLRRSLLGASGDKFSTPSVIFWQFEPCIAWLIALNTMRYIIFNSAY